MDSQYHLSSEKDDRSKVLSTLPTEIVLQILCAVPDFDSLKSIIVYVRYRDPVLRAVFINDLGGLVVDAVYVQKVAAELSGPDDDDRMTAIMDLILDWHDGREVETPSELLSVCGSEMLTDLLELHEKINALIPLYTECMIQALPPAALATLDGKPWVLSNTERKRITRGFCRFELLMRIMSARNSAEAKQRSLCDAEQQNIDRGVEAVISEPDLLSHIFCKFVHWELEEVSCVKDWIDSCYHSLFRSLMSQDRTRFWHSMTKKAICAGEPRLDRKGWCMCNTCEFGDPSFYGEYYTQYKTAFILSGLEQFLSISTASEMQMLRLISEQMDKFLPKPRHWHPQGLFAIEVFSHYDLDTLMRRYWYSVPEWYEDDPYYRFEGDCLSRPNAGWLWSQQTNWRSDHETVPAGGPWGYVMWDKARLDGLQVQSVGIVENRGEPNVTECLMGLSLP